MQCYPPELTRMNTPSEQELRLAFNVPNAVTALRVVLSPTIAWLLYQEEFLAAGILVLVAASTDGLDGFLARRLGQSTLGGSLFDLVADQILFIPNLVVAIAVGLFSRTDDLIPWNPYPFAVVVIAAGVAVLAGVFTYIWKRRSRTFEFPAPTRTAKAIFWFWLAPAVVAVFGVGPDILLAILMYLATIYTLFAFYSYLKKGSYVFTD
jgi:phosphatidylglycerophosphate synthase